MIAPLAIGNPIPTKAQINYVSHGMPCCRGCSCVAISMETELFFLSSCQIHLAMAPWGATDGRATVPLDPVEDGKFGQQPFFHSKTKPPNSRTTSRRPKILLSYGSTIHVSHATAYEISPVHASNYLQKACTKTNGCIVCDEKWRDVLCCITRTRGNGSVNY